MKKAITLSLLPVFLFSILGWQWMFFLKLYSHELKEWNRVPSEREQALVVIRIADGKAEKETYFINGHELIHNGKLFDVKVKTKRGNDLLCYCERDASEENLLSSFNLKTKDSFDNSFAADSKTQKVVKLSIFENEGTARLQVPVVTGLDLNPCFKIPFRLSSVCDSFFVPPEVA